jgi:hypothetical protein
MRPSQCTRPKNKYKIEFLPGCTRPGAPGPILKIKKTRPVIKGKYAAWRIFRRKAFAAAAGYLELLLFAGEQKAVDAVVMSHVTAEGARGIVGAEKKLPARVLRRSH